MMRRVSVLVAALVLAACSSNSGFTVPVSSSTTSTPATSTSTSTSTTVEVTTTTAPASTSTSTTVAPTAPPTTPSTVAPSTVPPSTVPPTVPHGSSTALWRLPTTGKVVAITIDAGSDVGYAARILDLLAAEHVHVTFGVTGAWAAAHPDMVRRMVAEGHQVMNHSYTHSSFTGASATDPLLTTQARLADLARAEELIRSLTGVSTLPFWRPPYGDHDASVLRDVALAGYAYTVLWTVDSRGWKGLPADQIVTRVLDLTEPGAILAFHLGSASADVDALGPIIDSLRADGYRFVTMAEAMGV